MTINKPLLVNIPVPVPQGTADFEKKRTAILDNLARSVPPQYRIACNYITEPRRDVTSIPRECGVLDDVDLEITEQYDMTSLAAAIAVKKYTAVQVTTAFLKRSIVAHQLSCCLTQWSPEAALQRAQELDEFLAREGKTVGPFHGVPISLKQHIPLANSWSDIGYLSTRHYDASDSALVSLLRKLGAVFYCKTNQPQGIMHLESDGYHGRTLNPHNIHLSSGGSSGGESALVALRGSIMGVGTDIGGSIRAPCGFVGIYGFKPTADTLPTRDLIRGGMPAELNVLCSAGPMCTSLRDVDFFMRQILAQKPYIQDPRVVPIPWTGLTTKLDFSPPRRLKVGIMMNDGFIQPQPPVIRALREAKNRLQASQLCEVKPFTAYNTEEGYNLVRAMYFPDGGNSCNVACEATGEPIHLLSADGNSYAEPKDSDELTQVRAQRDSFRTASSENWAAHDVDVVLCPVHVGPAAAHDTGRHISYTAIWNALDCPGIVFPTGLVAGQKGTERYADNDDKAWNPTDADVRDLWMTHDYEGAPIALQLVARRHHDNMLIAALHLLEDALQLNE